MERLGTVGRAWGAAYRPGPTEYRITHLLGE